MSDDTTLESRHVSQWIAAEAPAVYAFAVDPGNLPRWAAGLADPTLADAEVRFAPHNDFGVLDHVVRLPSGEEVYNPMRVIPAGTDRGGCEVVFTLRRLAGVTDAAFEADAALVAADLETLRLLVEASS
ncbi:polyketide cyclase [Mycobacterium antarcticum]|uniref:SRPBCC family protein n=1 Tax=unclassified Mycolicibacterium TaxID=2636767 RepID=UPI0023962735|nr:MULTISPECIES: SRPBCC family protein [unclassified Mycolicibacterium]BDX32541.1 polyketide cyclase [Mycolicibacterium sp. TUM20985]GLP83909.1 polyketide cyclase [Mycolicibacterium sp. TUM20984]